MNERARRNWDGLAAVIAALVGLLALCVSGYTAYLQRQQVRAQVWPYLETGFSSSKRGVMVYNKGAGPAIIRGVEIDVDGKPQRDWDAVFKALGLDFGHHIPYSTINGVVISAGDHVDQLAFPNAEDFNRYAHEMSRLRFVVCYCSSLGECWNYDDSISLPREARQPVAQCPARGEEQFLDNVAPEPALPAGKQDDKP